MPLESLRQPFDPEQVGHKLREVQVEQESEKEPSAKEIYEKVKERFFDEPLWMARWREGQPQPWGNAGLAVHVMIPYVEKKLGVESSLPASVLQNLEDRATTVRPDLATVALYFLSDNPKKARFLWERSLHEYFQYNEAESRYDSKDVQFASDPGVEGNLNLLFIESRFEPLAARKKLEAMKQQVGFNEKNQTWRDFGYNSSSVELLTLLIESAYDPSAAFEHFQRLKETEIYDKEKSLWLWAFGKEGFGKYALLNQLHALLLQRQLEIAGYGTLPKTDTKLPEERNF